MNCDHCRINLDWALANKTLFEVDGKQAELNLNRTQASPSGKMEADQQKHHGRITFMIVVILTMILSLITDSLCAPVLLLLFGAWFWFTESFERDREKELEIIWSELARQTGLTYIPGKRSFPSHIFPHLYGEYRGRYVSMSLEIEGSRDEYDISRVFTKIALQVINPAHLSLEISEKWLLTRRIWKKEILSGNSEFDQRFRVTGKPPEFVQRAINMPDLQNILLLDESQSKIMKAAYALSWASSSRPTITLKGWDLVCLVHGVLTLVDVQIAMLNMLCDLADLAEQTGSDSAVSDWMD